MMRKEVQIIGCTGKVDSVEEFIKKARDFILGNDILLQFMDADRILGKEHLISAIEHAQRAFKRKDNISSTLAMEILIYAAGEPQINNAIAKIGLKDGCERIAVVVEGDFEVAQLLSHLNLKRDDDVLEFKESKLPIAGISDAEISVVDKKKIMDLVLERVAMVDVRK